MNVFFSLLITFRTTFIWWTGFLENTVNIIKIELSVCVIKFITDCYKLFVDSESDPLVFVAVWLLRTFFFLHFVCRWKCYNTFSSLMTMDSYVRWPNTSSCFQHQHLYSTCVLWAWKGEKCFTIQNKLSLSAHYLNFIVVSFSIGISIPSAATHRFIVIVFPMRSRSLCTISNCRKAIVVVWVGASIISLPVLLSNVC